MFDRLLMSFLNRLAIEDIFVNSVLISAISAIIRADKGILNDAYFY